MPPSASVLSFRSRIRAAALLPLLALALPGASAAAREDATPADESPVPIVGMAVSHDASPPLAELARAARSGRAPSLVHQQVPPARGTPISGMDPALDTSRSLEAIPSPNLTFEGIAAADQNFTFILPPDTNGDVGPDHYMQWVNVALAVWTKDGTLVLGPVGGNTIWSGFGGVCQTENDGDPIVQYDQLADRWMISQFAVPGGPAGYHECVAVSQTPDPTGAWFRYDFKLSSTVFNDYPKLAVWPDAYYMSINQFDEPGYVGPGAVAFERDRMLSGQPARFVYFQQGKDPTLRPQLPSDLDGTNPPPPGSPNYFVSSVDGTPDRLSVYRFDVDWSNPTASTFTGPADLPTEPFDSSMCVSDDPTRGCIPQLGTPARLDDISDRVMYRLAYRNFGNHESLVVNQTVDTNGLDHGGIRWYELRRTGQGEWGIHQQSTFSPDIVDHRWMGSVALDGSGNIALGYSISGLARFPSIAYTGRLDADPPNTLPQGEAIMFAGTGSQHFPIGRWGDYSSMSVDPTDDCTFWYTSEYYTANPQEDRNFAPWHTRIGSFTFPQCGSDLLLTIAGGPDPVTVGESVTYTITVTNDGPGASQGVTVSDAVPVGMSFVSATPSEGSCTGTDLVTCSLGTLGIGASATVQVVLTAQQAGTVANAASAGSVTRDPDASNNSAQAQVTVIAA